MVRLSVQCVVNDMKGAPCLDCGSVANPFEVLEIDQEGRRKIRYLCVCGIVTDIWEVL